MQILTFKLENVIIAKCQYFLGELDRRYKYLVHIVEVFIVLLELSLGGFVR